LKNQLDALESEKEKIEREKQEELDKMTKKNASLTQEIFDLNNTIRIITEEKKNCDIEKQNLTRTLTQANKGPHLIRLPDGRLAPPHVYLNSGAPNPQPQSNAQHQRQRQRQPQPQDQPQRQRQPQHRPQSTREPWSNAQPYSGPLGSNVTGKPRGGGTKKQKKTKGSKKTRRKK
jgi:chromosome segregation ATPase